MKIFYGHSEGSNDVSSETPVETTVDIALGVFRGLDSRRGFMGVTFESHLCLQLLRRGNDRVEVELLDTSRPALDRCEAHVDFAESLIRAAFEGRDVFQVARQSDQVWEHLDMAG
jgi:hypothetical protein